MLKSISLFILICWSVTVHSQDLSGRKYFSYNDSVFEVGEVKILRGIVFDEQSVNPKSKPTLDSLEKFLEAHPNICICLKTYTDSTGNYLDSWELSDLQSMYLTRFIFDSTKIEIYRMVSVGVGDMIQIATNSTSEGRQMNRRTEVEIMCLDYGIPQSENFFVNPLDSVSEIFTNPSFNCLYKISFLNQIVEYGRKIVHDTIHNYSVNGDLINDTVISELGEGLRDNTFKPVSINSAPVIPQQVVVTSCDGTKNFEVEKIYFKRLMEENVGKEINGNFIDFNVFFAEADKLDATLYRISISSIYLKGIEEPIKFNDGWDGLIIYLK